MAATDAFDMSMSRPPELVPRRLRHAILAGVICGHAAVFAAALVHSANDDLRFGRHEVSIASLGTAGLDDPAEERRAAPETIPTEAAPAPEAKRDEEKPSSEDAPPLDQIEKPRPEAPRPEQQAAEAAASPGRFGTSETSAEEARGALIEYATIVSTTVNRLKFYPPEARQRGHSGRVDVSFLVDASGRISERSVARTSGNDALDRAALRMLTEARLPPPPNGAFRGRITIDFRVKG